MSTVLYGNLRAEIIGNQGARIQRVGFRQSAADLLSPRQPERTQKPLMVGRKQQIADAVAAIRAGRPVGFYAACGYGKTTLLRTITATGAEHGLVPSCIYLRAHGDRVGDLLQDLVDRLYACDQPVKLTPEERAQLLGQVNAVVAIDDLDASPDQVGYLLKVLSGCRLVIGSARPVLGRHGSSAKLNGLPEQTALALITDGLGRELTTEERAWAARLAAAVDGQPLHLRQCAALAREGRHSLRTLARQATRDPQILDRLAINALAQHERRALAALALAAGTLLPAAVVDVIGQVTYLAQWLESLHRRGLAEECQDRFGLPVCKADSYRQILLNDLDLATAARGLGNWLTAANPTDAESQSAAEAALSMMEFAAERGDWTTVVRLARTAERVLFLAGRWEAWHHTLSQGLDAAQATGDRAAEAFFAHQQGTLAFCRDQLDDAERLLQQALTLREQIGDNAGASITRHNLQLLELPDPPSPPRSRVPRRALRTVGGVLGTLALVAATVTITSVLHNGPPAVGKPTGPPSSPATHATSPAPPSGQISNTDPAQSSPSSGWTPSHPLLHLTPSALHAATEGEADSQQITAAGGTGPYSFSVTSGALPPGLSLSSQGAISGTPTATGSYQFTVTAADASTPPNNGSQSYTLQVNPPVKLTLSPTALLAATEGQADSQQITAAGGTGPYSFSVTSGALPPGLSLSSQGAISGTPTATGSYPFTVTAADASTPPNNGSQSYTLQVNPPVKLTLSPSSLPAEPSSCPAYQAQITAAGGTGPYSFSVTSGALPPGLSLSSQGAISGTPTATGSYPFTVTATDASTPPNNGSQSYTLNIQCDT